MKSAPVPASTNARSMALRSISQVVLWSIGTSMISRPSIFGTVRNGMYAGVGTTTLVSAAEKCRMADSSPVMTSSIGRMRSGATAQPYSRLFQALTASCMRVMSLGRV